MIFLTIDWLRQLGEQLNERGYKAENNTALLESEAAHKRNPLIAGRRGGSLIVHGRLDVRWIPLGSFALVIFRFLDHRQEISVDLAADGHVVRARTTR